MITIIIWYEIEFYTKNSIRAIDILWQKESLLANFFYCLF